MCKSCIITRIAILGATMFMALQVFGQSNIETVVQKGHLSQVICSDFSPDGKLIVTGSVDNSVKLWDAGNGKEIRAFNNHTEKIRSVQISNDGKFLLSAGADNKAIIQNLMTGEPLVVMPHSKDYLMKAVYVADGKYVLTMTNRDDMFLWDANTGALIKSYKKSFSSDISENTLSKSGHLILTSGNYKGCFAASVKSNDSLFFEFDKPFSMQFSPDASFVVIGSTKLFTGVFDARSGKQLFILEDDPDQKCDGCNTQVAVSSDSKWILTATHKVGLTLWDAKSGKKLKQFENDIKDRVEFIKFSPNNEYVLISDDKHLSIYNTKSGKLKFEWKHVLISDYEPVFSPDDKFLITPGENNTAYVWNIETGHKQQILSGYLNQRSNDGLGLEYSDWTERNILKFVTKKAAMAVTPDGKFILKGRIDSSVVMIDISTGREIRTFKGHHKSVLSLDISKDGKMLATGGGDGAVKIWDLNTGKELQTCKGHYAMVFDVHFNTSGTQLASSSWDATTRLWDVLSGEEIGYIKTGEVSQFTNKFLPGDLYLATGNLDKTLSVWELDSREEFRSYTGHTNIITGIDFSVDASQMYSTSWDGTLKVWDTKSGMLESKFKHDGAGLFSVAVHSQNGLVFSGGNDGLIRVWDLKIRTEIRQLQGHSGAVVSLCLTPDDKLVSCTEDGVIKVWDLKKWEELYTFMVIDRNNWLVKHKSGRFDGSAEAMKMVNYVSGMDVVPVGSLFQKYYVPGLLKRIMQGEEFKDIGQNIDSDIRSVPKTTLALAGAGKRQISIEQDSVLLWRKNKIPLTISVDESDESLGDVRVYRNGKLIINEPFVEQIVFRGGEGNSRTFEVDLADGINEISVVVTNKRSVESDPAKIKVEYDGEAALTDLYILSIGINAYKNPDYKLNFAVNDANAFTKTVVDGSTDLFNKVHEFNIRDTQADKTQISAIFNEIIKSIGPEDVFVFYYAGHGVMSIEQDASEFYVVTFDVTNFYGGIDQLKEKAISAEELMDFSRRISAEKQLFVMDACQSGGALKAFAQRGAVREKALAQLARSTGTFFLTASEDAQYANEVGGLEHGMFTYAILEALTGTADGVEGDLKITVNELKSYVEDRVPELSEQYQGSPQYPTSYSFGQDFPVTLVAPK